MTTIRIQALPKFPATVEAGDGMIITRSAGVFTFAVDPDFIPALDPTLQALALLPTAADKLPYFTGADTAALADFSAFGRTLVDDANGSAALTTLGISTFAKTILDDVDAAAVRATISAASLAVNSFTGAQTITVGAPGIIVLSGGASGLSSIQVGRTGAELEIGVAGGNNEFFAGTSAGHTAVRASAGNPLWLGSQASTPGIKINFAGTLVFPQHVSGALLTDGSGNVTATTNTGTGSNVLTTSPTVTTPNIVGTTAAGNAAAGSVGEVIESEIVVGSAVSQTTGTSVNITSISLTAGDWDVRGTYFTNMAGGTTTTGFEAAIHTVSATLPTRPNKGAQILMNCSGVGQNYGATVGQKRINVSGTTTVYLVANASFSGSTLSGYGYLGARRVR